MDHYPVDFISQFDVKFSGIFAYPVQADKYISGNGLTSRFALIKCYNIGVCIMPEIVKINFMQILI